jgi:hypothetical protein
MAALDDFFKSNVAGPVNKLFLAGYIREIATAENKWKAVGNVILQLAIWSSKLVLPTAFVAAWVQMGRIVQSIVRDTGSLEAALRRLSQIQGLQRTFTPLLGGLSVAKQRVAELIQFTSRNKIFKLEEVAEASRSLQVWTRGVYSGNDALTAIQDTAINSGNGIAEVANEVGQFYATLRDGEPITQSTERLRQMGVISQQTADYLNSLQKSGASTQEVFTGLQGSLAGAKPPEAGEDLATVQQRHAEAIKNLQQQAGAAFTADEIQNTKNYTDAMIAIGPAVGRVSGYFAILTNGLSTVKSSIAKAAAESPALRGGLEFVAKAIGAVAAAGLVFGAIKIPMVLAGWASAMGTATTATVILRTALMGLSVATGVVGAILVIGTAIGMIIQYSRQQAEAAKRTREMAQAHREAQAAINAHIAAIKTLTDRHESLAEQIERVTQLQKELDDLLLNPRASDKEVEEKKRALREAEAGLKQTAAAGAHGLAGPEAEEVQRIAAQRRLQKEQTDFERQLAAHPERREELTTRRQAQLRARAETGFRGLAAREAVAETRSQLEGERAKIEASIKKAEVRQKTLAGLPKPTEPVELSLYKENRERNAAELKKQREALTKLDAQIETVGLKAPAGTSVQTRTVQQMLLHGIRARELEAGGKTEEAARERALSGGATITKQTPAQIQKLGVIATVQEQLEQRAAETEAQADQMETERRAMVRQRTAQAALQDLALREHGIRRGEEGTVTPAPSPLTRLNLADQLDEKARQREGAGGGVTLAQSRLADQLADTKAFGEHFEEQISMGFSKADAIPRAMALTADELKQNTNLTGLPQIADSLTRIGGGGGIYAPGGDPRVRLQERLNKLVEDSNTYLQTIAGREGGVE